MSGTLHERPDCFGPAALAMTRQGPGPLPLAYFSASAIPSPDATRVSSAVNAASGS